MSQCQNSKCKSDRIISINAKCDDRFCASIDDAENNGYVPYDMNIGGGDYVEFDFCANCGQIQAEFPMPPSNLESEKDSDEDEQYEE